MARLGLRKRKQPSPPRSSRVQGSVATRESVESTTDSDAYSTEAEAESFGAPHKRRKIGTKHSGKSSNTKPWKVVLSLESPARTECPTAVPLSRTHRLDYHRPLLLDNFEAREALLEWFDGVSSSRLMPWRKPWIDPRAWENDAEGLRAALECRAYQVWISEIMLQQTRVAVVIDYWKRWMDKWPTIQDLAGADAEHVLAAWRGLGYYSRATRIHQAAKLVAEDPSMRGLLPAEATELKAKVPGIGPYTAGAISAIVFGHPEAMVDGNVVRVLSRQLGLLADFKGSKTATDWIWAAADVLAKVVSSDLPEEGDTTTSHIPNDRPGRWGQALMELGSTVCTPKPDCSQCPITSTCRAFAEGVVAAATSRNAGQRPPYQAPTTDASTTDIEDMCALCQPMEEDITLDDGKARHSLQKAPVRSRRKAPLASNSSGSLSSTESGSVAPTGYIGTDTLAVVVDYARRFPAKGQKKAVRVQESLVCAIRCGDLYLIQKRPAKGLLAGLWELPSYDLPEGSKSTVTSRKAMAQSHICELLGHWPPSSTAQVIKPRYVGELGSVPWLFSHISLTMHVHLFSLDHHADISLWPMSKGRWANDHEIETASTMGTGMRKCWTMVKSNPGS